MMDRGLAPLTVKLHRGALPLLFEFLSPKLPFEREEYDRAVRKVEVYKITEDRVPTREEARRVLVHAPNPKSKAFNVIMVCTGRRINEVSTLRIRDVDFSVKPVRVYFQAGGQKIKKAEAMAFLTAEAAEIVQTYLKNRGFQSKWLFPGSMKNKPIDRPIAKSNAWRIVVDAFRTAGLDQKDEGGRNQYHPQCWRKFSANQMRATGFNETWIDWIVGWDTGAKARYKDWETIGRIWGEKCEAQFTFLGSPEVARTVKLSQLEGELRAKGIDPEKEYQKHPRWTTEDKIQFGELMVRQTVPQSTDLADTLPKLKIEQSAQNGNGRPYETKLVNQHNEEEIADLVAQGWDLVSATPVNGNGNLLLRRKLA